MEKVILDMKILFYLPEPAATDQRFQRLVDQVNLKATAEVIRTLNHLDLRLRQPKYDLAFAVLFAQSTQGLEDLMRLGDLLNDLKIILILPDKDRETVLRGHKIFPRFVTDISDDFWMLEAVIEKMLNNLDPNLKIQNKTS